MPSPESVKTQLQVFKLQFNLHNITLLETMFEHQWDEPLPIKLNNVMGEIMVCMFVFELLHKYLELLVSRVQILCSHLFGLLVHLSTTFCAVIDKVLARTTKETANNGNLAALQSSQ